MGLMRIWERISEAITTNERLRAELAGMAAERDTAQSEVKGLWEELNAQRIVTAMTRHEWDTAQVEVKELREKLDESRAACRGLAAALERTVADSVPDPPADDDSEAADDEEFCDDCAAGTESPEHHEKCVDPDTVERVAKAIDRASSEYLPPDEARDMAKAAINAIGGGDE